MQASPKYRYTIELDADPAELSSLQVIDGKVVVRLLSDNPNYPKPRTYQETTHLSPLRFVAENGQYQVLDGQRAHRVLPSLWTVLDTINRQGSWDGGDCTYKRVQKLKERANSLLSTMGAACKIEREGTVLSVSPS